MIELRRGKERTPFEVLLYGEKGLGKTTWGAESPNPVILCAEEGSSQLDVARLPKVETWDELMAMLREYVHGDLMGCETLVVDTVNALLEEYLFPHVCRINEWASMDVLDFGKCYSAASVPFRQFLALCDYARTKRGMNVVYLGHSKVTPVNPPDGEAYDMYVLAIAKSLQAQLYRKVECVFFAQQKVVTVKDKSDSRKNKGLTGDRVIHTTEDAAFHAKNRFCLPKELPLDYSTFHAAWIDFWEKDWDPILNPLLAQIEDQEKRARNKKLFDRSTDKQAFINKLTAALAAKKGK